MGRCMRFIHGRSHISRDLSHLYNAGMEHVGYSPNREKSGTTGVRHRVRFWASRVKEKLNPAKNHL